MGLGNIEIWKPIKRWEGLYEISNMGRVKSLGSYRIRGCKRKKVWYPNKIRKLCKQRGYLSVNLVTTTNSGKISELFYIHMLVAINFLKVPSDTKKFKIHFIDGNKNNCKVSNLKIITCWKQVHNRKVYKYYE